MKEKTWGRSRGQNGEYVRSLMSLPEKVGLEIDTRPRQLLVAMATELDERPELIDELKTKKNNDKKSPLLLSYPSHIFDTPEMDGMMSGSGEIERHYQKGVQLCEAIVNQTLGSAGLREMALEYGVEHVASQKKIDQLAAFYTEGTVHVLDIRERRKIELDNLVNWRKNSVVPIRLLPMFAIMREKIMADSSFDAFMIMEQFTKEILNKSYVPNGGGSGSSFVAGYILGSR